VRQNHNPFPILQAIVDELGRAGFRPGTLTSIQERRLGTGHFSVILPRKLDLFCDQYRSWNRNALRQANLFAVTDFVMAR